MHFSGAPNYQFSRQRSPIPLPPSRDEDSAIDEDAAATAPGTGLDQLVLWWQDEPGGAWQQRVLDERPNDAPGECYIP
jgi:hypothetical protein